MTSGHVDNVQLIELLRECAPWEIEGVTYDYIASASFNLEGLSDGVYFDGKDFEAHRWASYQDVVGIIVERIIDEGWVFFCSPFGIALHTDKDVFVADGESVVLCFAKVLARAVRNEPLGGAL